MSDAPERIWAGPDDNAKGWGLLRRGEDVFWEDPENSTPEDRSGLSEYVRADVVDAIVAEKVREALTEAAYIARNACLVPPDGGNPTEYERLVCDEASRRILALRDQKEKG